MEIEPEGLGSDHKIHPSVSLFSTNLTKAELVKETSRSSLGFAAADGVVTAL